MSDDPDYGEVVASLQAIVRGQANPTRFAGEFLTSIGLVEAAKLTPDGQNLYTRLLVQREAPEAVWPPYASQWPPFRLVMDVFSGRSDVPTAAVRELLYLHGQADWAARGTMGAALEMGAKMGLWEYMPRRGRLHVAQIERKPDSRRTIHPETPFSNLRALEKLVASCENKICWLDKHFGIRGLEVIAEQADAARHQHALLLVGNGDQAGDRFQRAAARLEEELRARGISFELRFLAPADERQLHDRWLGDGTTWWNLPPLNSILQGQHGEILRATSVPFEELWSRAPKERQS